MAEPRGAWLIKGTPITRTYPCACTLGQRCRPWVPGGAYCCPCAGRTDHDTMPAHCCARRAVETATRREAA